MHRQRQKLVRGLLLVCVDKNRDEFVILTAKPPSSVLTFVNVLEITPRHPLQTKFGSDAVQRPSFIPSSSDSASHYNSTLCQLLDGHAPATTRPLPDRPFAPWYTPEISQAKRKRRQAKRRWCCTKLTVHRQMYQQEKRKVQKLIFSAKTKHHNKYFIDSSSSAAP